MNGLADQAMLCLLNGEDKRKTLFLDWVVVAFGPNQGSAKVVGNLFEAFIIHL